MKFSNKIKFSGKHILIDKANSIILLSAVVTVAIVMFSVVVSKAFVGQIAYQNKVIGLRSDANKQLQANIKSVDAVVSAYNTFEGTSESVIGTPDKNTKIVLDALPSKYDFPALATSLEALILDSGATIGSISGTDDEALAEQNSIIPQPIEIPFSITAKGSLAAISTLINKLEHSIRPIKIDAISLAATGGDIQVVITAKTYYQPEKKLGITQSTVDKSGHLTSSETSNNNGATTQ